MNIEGLKDTIVYMVNSDYKKRFIAEYAQLYIRCRKLEDMLAVWDAGNLSFTPTCPREMYDQQLEYMNGYLQILVERARIEDVELPSITY